MPGGRVLLAGGVAAGLTWALMAARDALPAGVRVPFARTNYAGEPVSLLEGPAWVVGSGLAAAAVGDPVATAVVLVPGTVGLADDLVGDTKTKGLRGHLGALRRGRVTTGAAKIGLLVATGLGAAAAEQLRLPRADRRLTTTVVDAGVVAGSANLVNLFDLRPGRALKVTAILATPLLLGARIGDRPALASAIGASLGALPSDLAGRTMLGDSGSNAAGAALGLAAVRGLPPHGRVLALAVLVALTVASERVSFSQVIAEVGPLRALDEWGRPRTPGP